MHCERAALSFGVRRGRYASPRRREKGVERMNTVFKVQDRVNPRVTLEASGFQGAARVHYNLLEPALMQAAVGRGGQSIRTQSNRSCTAAE